MATILLTDAMLNCEPLVKLSDAQTKISSVTMPTGLESDGMDAILEAVNLFERIGGLLNSYSELISYDVSRIKNVIEGFVQADKA